MKKEGGRGRSRERRGRGSASYIPYSAKYSREKTFANLPRNELREENFRDRQGPTYDVCENLKFRGRKLSRREKNREIRESFLPRIFCAIRYVLQSKVFSSVWGLEQDVIQFALLARLALPPFSAALFNLAFKPNCLCCRNVLESASF